MNKKIFLIGLMGCGKTTIGKLLSEQLNYFFIDTDLEIENQIGQSISNIFEKKGENYFRNIESNVMDKILLKKGNLVIATGGGTPCFNNNLIKMTQAGTVIFLSCNTGVIAKRIKNNLERPLIKGSKNVIMDINKMLIEREPFYCKAHYAIDVSESTPKEIVAELLNFCLK